MCWDAAGGGCPGQPQGCSAMVWVGWGWRGPSVPPPPAQGRGDRSGRVRAGLSQVQAQGRAQGLRAQVPPGRSICCSGIPLPGGGTIPSPTGHNPARAQVSSPSGTTASDALGAGNWGTWGKSDSVSPTRDNMDWQLPRTWCHQGHHLSLSQLQLRGLGKAPGCGHCVTRSVGGQSGTGDTAPGGLAPCGHTGCSTGYLECAREN